MRVVCQPDFEFYIKKAGRSVCPRKHDFGRLCTDFRWEKCGGKNEELMMQALDARVKQNVEENSNSSVVFKKYVELGDNIAPFILAIATLLMKRVPEKISFYIIIEKMDSSSQLI